MTITVATAADVAAAFHDPAFEPPPPLASIGEGATAQLRASMARFSDRRHHAPRRAAVLAAIDPIDPVAVRSVAFDAATRTLDGVSTFDLVADVAFRLPTETMLTVLGVRGDRSALVADVAAVAEVIGRGVAASGRHDRATQRVLAACGGSRVDPVPTVSLLYQTYEATGALLIETVVARHRNSVRAPAVTRTTRIAVADTAVGDVIVRAGEIVVFDLRGADLEFGAGAHRCPGRSVAEAIVDGVTAAIDSAGFVVRHVSPTLDSNDRASSVLMGLRS